ncbi:MAG TPA: hypothetical protein PLJ27_04570 [Polyangiaceae bacterium]|jgi:hypothetical protein|nr:MAG: hypothetical protein BWY17_01562 [Deltaproteobacteria bacterium ADurb.Bin207]HNS99422.1 hypothetical protein [Polyangiaceae bacterium]HNZ22774.1 hypothetical protein [Polyangiaceae bacterium]HOD22839.1 hypothetical protein [Polyangiaceae bacterium]HOE47672.1 hypothetical protein [Polyangiaceae bacterium]
MQKAVTISELIHHIKQCPSEFLDMPARGENDDGVHTLALVNDILRYICHCPTTPCLLTVEGKADKTAEWRLWQVCCWALSHPVFFEAGPAAQWIPLFSGRLDEVSTLVETEKWVTDEERAEELARILLSHAAIIPEGEDATIAADRLDAIDTVKRMKVIEQTRQAELRTQEIRRQMAARAAREAANAYGRE